MCRVDRIQRPVGHTHSSGRKYFCYSLFRSSSSIPIFFFLLHRPFFLTASLLLLRLCLSPSRSPVCHISRCPSSHTATSHRPFSYPISPFSSLIFLLTFHECSFLYHRFVLPSQPSSARCGLSNGEIAVYDLCPEAVNNHTHTTLHGNNHTHTTLHVFTHCSFSPLFLLGFEVLCGCSPS